MSNLITVLTMLVATAAMLAAFAPFGGSALECTDVAQYITPCVPYVTGRAGIGTCCNGIKGLYNAAQTTPDRQSACNCLKSLTNGYTSGEIAKAALLPAQCSVHLPYRIDPSTDCARVH